MEYPDITVKVEPPFLYWWCACGVAKGGYVFHDGAHADMKEHDESHRKVA